MISDFEIRQILLSAKTANLDLIDTAIAYGDCEQRLGRSDVSAFKVISKLPSLDGITIAEEKFVRQAVGGSIARLKVPSLHGVLLHEAQDWNRTEVRNALLVEKAEGRCHQVGVSIYSPADLDKLANWWCLDVVQTPFNVIDRRLETSGWLRRLYDSGIEVHVRSIFLQGLLTLPLTTLPDYFKRWEHLFKMWHAWLSSNNITAIKACMTFATKRPEIARVIVGVESVAQLRQLLSNYAAPMDIELPDLDCRDESLLNPSLWEIR